MAREPTRRSVDAIRPRQEVKSKPHPQKTRKKHEAFFVLRRMLGNVFFFLRAIFHDLARLARILLADYPKTVIGAVVAFLSLVLFLHYSTATITNLYPANCLGGWENPQNAQGEPDIGENPSPTDFTGDNSAVLRGAAAQIFCSNFQGEVPENSVPKKIHLKLSWFIGERELPGFSGTQNQESSQAETITATDNFASSTDAITQVIDADESSKTELKVTESEVAPVPEEKSGEDSPSTETSTPEETPASVPDLHAATPDPIPAPAEASAPTPEPAAPAPAPVDSAPTSFLEKIFTSVFAAEITPVDPGIDTAGTIQTESSTTSVVQTSVPVESAPAPEPKPEPSLAASILSKIFGGGNDETPTPEAPAPEPISSSTSVPADAGTSSESLATSSPSASTTDIMTAQEPSAPAPTPEGDFLEVLYTLDGKDWVSLGKVSKTNWKEADFEIPVLPWEDISKIQVSVQSLPVIDPPSVFLDGMNMEIEYDVSSDIDLDKLASQNEADQLEKKEIRKERVFNASKEGFTADENPTFELYSSIQPGNDQENAKEEQEKERKRIEAAALSGRIISPEASEVASSTPASSTPEQISWLNWSRFIPIARAQSADTNIRIVKAELLESNGRKASLDPTLEEVGGKTRVKVLRPEREFVPGNYYLRVEFIQDDIAYVATQDFSWGVLAINTDKSIYHVGDNAYIQMAALDSNGHTLCKAPLELSITSPSGDTQIFSTASSTISLSSDCGIDNVTNNPDYFLHFPIKALGTYDLSLKNTSNGKMVESTLEVNSNAPFEVTRRGATRINPFKASSYSMNLTVKANQNFDGQVTEALPKGFQVVPSEEKFSASVTTDGDTQYVTWKVKNVKAGATFLLQYEYSAPQISPELYLLGPLRFTSGNFLVRLFGQEKTDFEEARQWQLASDAVTVKVRQEINILDGWLNAASGAYATSSEIIQIDTTQYTSPTYYFEVVASTTSATNANMYLVNASTYAVVATITVNGTSYARYRSTSFTPTTGANNYVVVLGNEAVGKGAIAARVVVLQATSAFANTETQIEIGNNESFSTVATTTFASPKYWYYDSTKWAGTNTFYAEVSWKTVKASLASSTTYSTAGTFTVGIPAGTASTSVGLWGGGGAGGGCPATANTGGAGGAGGQFASSTLAALTGTHTLVVAATKAGGSNQSGGAGNDSSWDTTSVVAKGGAGGGVGTGGSVASSTGSSTGCIGTVCFAGGTSGAGAAKYGGGGGGGAGTNGAGGSATGAAVAGTGTTVGGGAGGAKRTTSNNGAAGTSRGGGGGGAFTTTAAARTGGTGAQGQGLVTNYMASTTIALQEDDGSFGNWTDKAYIAASTSAGVATRARSSAFTPTSGRNYRIVLQSNYTGVVVAIYNAKIIVDQTSPTKLEAQYLIANTKLRPGTGLQSFNSLWDSTEWNDGYTYIHEVDSVSAGTSDVKLQDTTGPADITGSTVTDAIQREQSSSLTMPTTGRNMDVVATTNNNDIYASRILVQVDTSILTTTFTQKDYRWYDNANAVQPGSAFQLENTAHTLTSTSSPIRLRMNVTVGGKAMSASSSEFKLQYAYNTSGTWFDVDNWWDTTWQNRKKISFSNASANADLSEFVIPVQLRATANGVSGAIDYSKTQDSGQDIRFVDANGTTTLPYEIEKWDETGTSTVLVKVPRINAATTTDFIWMYYNNTSAVSAAATTSVWATTGAQGVWHLGNKASSTAGAFLDATSNANNGTGSGGSSLASTTGKIDGAYNFDGTDDYVNTGLTTHYSQTTISVWVNVRTSGGGTLGRILEKRNGGAQVFAFYPDINNSVVSFNRQWTGGGSDAAGNAKWNTGTALSTNAWHHVVLTYDESSTANDPSIYFDGVAQSVFVSVARPTGSVVNNADAYYIGNRGDATRGLDGNIDDMRVYNRILSADEVLAEYKAGAGTLLTYGSEESAADAPWEFYGNSSAVDGTNITSTLLTASEVKETYESGNFSASTTLYSIPVGQEGEWDWSLLPAHATSTTTYYFRMIDANGEVVFSSYTNYPTITVDTTNTLTQRDYRWYLNANSVQPGSAAQGENVANTISSVSTPIRLRMNVTANNSDLAASSAEFALQYAYSTAGPWTPVGWWNTSWLNRKKISFNNASASADLGNFVVPVQLRATANGVSGAIDYTKTQDLGQDIRFVDANGTTTLPYEIEKWDETGTSTIHVKVPRINAATTTDYIWMYYNNPSASDGQSVTSVWSNTSAQGVWHMNNAASSTAGAFTDSTSAANNATGRGGPSLASTTGVIDGAYSLDGTDDYMDVSNESNFDFERTQPFTLSAWIYHTGNSSTDYIFGKQSSTTPGGNGYRGYALNLPSSGGCSGCLEMGLVSNANSNLQIYVNTTSNPLTLNSWYHVTVTYAGTSLASGVSIYVNGVVQPVSVAVDTLGTNTILNNVNLNIGTNDSGNLANAFQGYIDEARVYNRVLTTDEILAQYKAGAGTFLTYGSEESESTNAWNFYNGNNSATDGANVTANLLTASDVKETYESANFSATSTLAAIPAGQEGEWDWALDPVNATSTTYYFRMVKANGDIPFYSYTNYPQLTGSFTNLTLTTSQTPFPTLTPGTPQFSTTTVVVTTNNSSGWSLSLYGNDRVTGDTTMDLTTNATIGLTDQTEWIPGAATTSAGNAVRISSLANSQKVLAFRVMTASGSEPFIAPTWWGSVDSYSDNASTLWAGVSSSTIARQIGNSSAPAASGATSTVLYYLDVPSSQQTGSYDGVVTYTATVNP